ncbi:hypothetical protein SAMN04489726_4621 [Allokutzneria albata]|uniref:Uncharacterized protein n=1 Tax=Allokutzneria albata TaxID=211114 RepID=A0A1G9Y5P6_ALLAB|nr:hypothetical protein SAMN04489726_4621 [Allokutzneria albata]
MPSSLYSHFVTQTSANLQEDRALAEPSHPSELRYMACFHIDHSGNFGTNPEIHRPDSHSSAEVSALHVPYSGMAVTIIGAGSSVAEATERAHDAAVVVSTQMRQGMDWLAACQSAGLSSPDGVPASILVSLGVDELGIPSADGP